MVLIPIPAFTAHMQNVPVKIVYMVHIHVNITSGALIMKSTDYTTILNKLINEFPTMNPTLLDETLHEAVTTLLERKHIEMEPDNE